jgi:cytidylate kinase
MSVITISRGSFSGGKILAECLSRRLGYRCIDRDDIVERAAAYAGVSQDDLKEAMEKPPTFFDRFKHKRYLYLTLVQAALTEEVRTGKVIYHGLAGHLLLKGGRPVLRTRIIAPMEFRIQMVQDRLKYSRNEAIAYVDKVDQARQKWTQFLYGVDWGDPSLYDVVLNLEQIAIEEACHVIASMVIERCFELTPDCQQKMDDLALGSRVRADLALNSTTSDLELEVFAHNGAIAVKGKLATLGQLDDVKRVALATPGVTYVDMDELAPPVRA